MEMWWCNLLRAILELLVPFSKGHERLHLNTVGLSKLQEILENELTTKVAVQSPQPQTGYLAP